MIYQKQENGLLIRVRISPNSSSCSVKGIFTSADGEDFLKVNVISVPERGKANRELITFLAKKLKIAKSNFEIISGETDRYKKILIKTDVLIEEIEKLVEGN
ncbi:MAG: DUF167 family protein [Alphaproteobacteria bacterium]|nr:DUF167 family protein [Alphaproteobacteria bacterium]